jgi:hypothetical protein
MQELVRSDVACSGSTAATCGVRRFSRSNISRGIGPAVVFSAPSNIVRLPEQFEQQGRSAQVAAKIQTVLLSLMLCGVL